MNDFVTTISNDDNGKPVLAVHFLQPVDDKDEAELTFGDITRYAIATIWKSDTLAHVAFR